MLVAASHFTLYALLISIVVDDMWESFRSMIIRPCLSTNAGQVASWAGVESEGVPSLQVENQHLVLSIKATARTPTLSYMEHGLKESSPLGGDCADGLIQVRAETLTCSAHLRADFLRRRCLVPANSIEVSNMVGQKEAVRYLMTPRSRYLFWLAAIYEPENHDEGVQRFALIDERPDSLLREKFDRLPVVISDDDKMSWLAAVDRNAALRLLRPMSTDQIALWTIEAHQGAFGNLG